MDGSVPLTEQGGICLTFDDWFVKNWFRARSLFLEHDARCTFYIARPDKLRTGQIDRLKQLAEDGHEVGFHTTNHSRITKYLRDRTLEDYLRIEIDAGLAMMKAIGFRPTTFSYPYHRRTDDSDRELLKRFKILRYRHPARNRLARLVKPGTAKVVNILGSLDMTGEQRDIGFYERRFDLAMQHKAFGVLCGHNIGDHGKALVKDGQSAFVSLKDLERILVAGTERGVRFAPVRSLI